MQMNTWLYTMTSVGIVSIISLIGVVTLAINKDMLKKMLLFLVSFAVGALFGDAFIHLIPESFKAFGFNLASPFFIMLGIVIFFVLEKFVRWRHCHTTPCEENHSPVALMNLAGDGIHNLIDGMLIGASYEVSIPIGLATTIAVVLHEIPQEVGDFGVLVHGGYSIKKALFYNFLLSFTAVAGAIASLIIGPHLHDYAQALIPITAGGFIYIAGSDLIPELQHEVKINTSLGQFICIILGFVIMSLLTFLEIN